MGFAAATWGRHFQNRWFPHEGCESTSFTQLAQLRAILSFYTLGVRFSFLKKMCSRNRNYLVLSPLGLPCTHRWDADGRWTGKCRAQTRAGRVDSRPRSPAGHLRISDTEVPVCNSKAFASRLLRKVKAESEQFTNY